MSNHNLNNVHPVPYTGPPAVIEEEPPRRRWPWLKIILALIGGFIMWRLLAAYEVWRIYAGIIAVFWFFALGIHPIHAAGRTIHSWFDDDD